MNNLINILFAIAYWVATYFVPVQFAYFVSAVATLNILVGVYNSHIEKQRKERVLAETLARLNNWLP